MALKKFAAGLDNRYEQRRQRLHGTVTAAPMVSGRSTGQLVATIAGVAGVHVNVSKDLRAPITVGDGILVEGVGTPAAMSYDVVGRVSAHADSDVYLFPAETTVGDTTYEPGDIVLGSTLADWSNWWYEFAQGRWRIRKGKVLQGAIGNLSGLYDYNTTVYGSVFGEYAPGKVWISTDPQNGLRIMAYDTRTLHVDVDGTIRTGRAEEAEIVIAPGAQQISFVINGVVQSAIDAESRTIYGFERLGLPLGPAIEWGPIPDASGEENLERWGFWLRNDEGDRFLAILSGTAAAPDSASFRLGKTGASQYLQMQDGKLSWAATNTSMSEDGIFTALNAVLSGTITAAGGTIGGFVIAPTTLSASNLILSSAGTLTLGTSSSVVKLSAADATWRLAIGNATMGSAPFRVSKAGALYAETVNIAAGNTTINNDGITIIPGEDLSSSITWSDGTAGVETRISGQVVDGSGVFTISANSTNILADTISIGFSDSVIGFFEKTPISQVSLSRRQRRHNCATFWSTTA